MNTETATQLTSKITDFKRFYDGPVQGRQNLPPANFALPELIDIEDLRTEKTRGKMPVTLRFGFNFEGREDYIAWVKAWKEVYGELTLLMRKARTASRAARIRNRLTGEEQNRANDAEIEAWSNYNKANHVVRHAFHTAFPAETWFGYNMEHKEMARLLLSLRRAAKIAAGRQRVAHLTAKAA